MNNFVEFFSKQIYPPGFLFVWLKIYIKFSSKFPILQLTKRLASLRNFSSALRTHLRRFLMQRQAVRNLNFRWQYTYFFFMNEISNIYKRLIYSCKMVHKSVNCHLKWYHYILDLLHNDFSIDSDDWPGAGSQNTKLNEII